MGNSWAHTEKGVGAFYVKGHKKFGAQQQFYRAHFVLKMFGCRISDASERPDFCLCSIRGVQTKQEAMKLIISVTTSYSPPRYLTKQ